MTSDFTRRLTWPEDSKTDDWVFIYRGKDAGRCYRDSLAGVDRWRWSIYEPRLGSGVSDRGYCDSFEAAQSDFKESFLKMFGAAD